MRYKDNIVASLGNIINQLNKLSDDIINLEEDSKYASIIEFIITGIRILQDTIRQEEE